MVVPKRNPNQTRSRILKAAFVEIHRHGFRAASLDQILADTGLTKGALYHHFPNKSALGYAVLDELIGGRIRNSWVEPLAAYPNPIDGLLDLLSARECEPTTVSATGCPLNNLAQEMSSIDDEFRQRIAAVYRSWTEGVADRLLEGQQAGCVCADVNCMQAATFFVASMQGAIGLAKNSRDPEVLHACVAGVRRYLESLRPTPAG